MSVPAVYFVLSGGASNTLPANALGGAASTVNGGILVTKTATPQSAEIAGVAMVGVMGGENGVHQLSWQVSGGLLSWTTPAGAVSQTAVSADGLLMLSANGAQVFVDIAYASLPGTDSSVDYSVGQASNPLFDNVELAERQSNHFNYRCLYLYNNTASVLTNVELEVMPPPTYGTMLLGSEYKTSGITKLPTAQYTEHNAVTFGGVRFLQARPAGFAADQIDYYRGYEFKAPSVHAGVVTQASDGVSVEIPTVLVDELDSTNLLAGIEFTKKITWPAIAAGKYVSCWVRRYIAANTSGTGAETQDYSLRILYED